MLKFGDYILVEMNRYGAKNEFYIHKVIGTLESNSYTNVPVVSIGEKTGHDKMVLVVDCIQCGVCEEEVVRFRISDVKYDHSEARPTPIDTKAFVERFEKEFVLQLIGKEHWQNGISPSMIKNYLTTELNKLNERG